MRRSSYYIPLLCSLLLFKLCSPELRNGSSDKKYGDGEDDKPENGTDKTAEKAVELLNKIVQHGIEQSKFLTDVQEKRLFNQGITLKKKDPAHFVAVFNKEKDRARELSRYAYASLEASSLLARQ